MYLLLLYYEMLKIRIMNRTMLRLFTVGWMIFFDVCNLKAQYLDYVHDNLTRQYTYYAPSNLHHDAPLVFVLHGYTSDASVIQNYSKMDSIADQYSFAVCYPRGTIDSEGNRFWNVGYDFHEGVTIDDVDFLVQLALYLQDEHDLSSQNTFVTGMSNGGEMSYLLACRTTVFKAVAPVAGMMLETFFDTCDSNKPVSIFEIHGTKDKINRYDGDINSKDGWGAYPDIPFTIDYWISSNDCNSTQIDTLPDTNTNDGSYVIRERHLNCIDNNQVWLYKIVNGGHDWPGSSGNMDIQTSQHIWDFFNMFITK